MQAPGPSLPGTTLPPTIFRKGVGALQKLPQPSRVDSIIVTFLRKRKQNKGNILEINDRKLLFGGAGGELGEHHEMEGKKVISGVSGGNQAAVPEVEPCSPHFFPRGAFGIEVGVSGFC